MKRYLLILVLGLAGILFAGIATADDYIDDLYYNPQLQVDMQLKAGTLQPHYNKQKMQELVFVADSTQLSPAKSAPQATPADTLAIR